MIFEVTDEQIERLNDTDLRSLVGLLCEEEVRLHGHSPVSVTRGGNQNAADGGIDVRVSLHENAAIAGYVPAPATGFQVKAQDMPRQLILNEMAPGGILRSSIAELAARNGAYIIVSSKGSVADTALSSRRQAMIAAIDGKVADGSLALDFYDRHRVATWVNQHPGLVPWVRERVGVPIAGWRAYGDWSSSPTALNTPYLLDDAVRLLNPTLSGANGLSAIDGLNKLRQLLERPKGVVRLVGLSGVGKTRLVQALFDSRVGVNWLPDSQAVYADISDCPDPVPFELVSQLISLKRRAVVIVDNCGAELHRKLAAKVVASDSLLSLITIEYDITDDEPENTDVFKLEPASVEVIEKILESKFPAIPAPSRRVIAKFSDGNSRVALALAHTAKAGESLVNLRDTELFKRLFDQAKGPSEELLSAAKVCALLYSFDGETVEGIDGELAHLADLAGLDVNTLYKHVAELTRRQLVQKRGKWRAILPHALAHRLAKLALDDIPFQRIRTAILNSGSERMLRSFSRRIGYLHDNSNATSLVAEWFGDGGLLEPLGKLNELGKSLLINVAPVDPPATLAFIEKAAARNSWFFGPENLDRKEIVRVLRSIAYDSALFNRCVLLLKNFALLDANENGDSAAKNLKSLFFLYLSGTHASPQQRAAFIKQLLESDDDRVANLGLNLLKAMFECEHFSSHYSFEFGARSRDFGSNPRRRNEIVEWFEEAIQVASVVGQQDRPMASKVRTLVASKFSALCRRVGMIDQLAALAERYTKHSGWPEGWIGVRAAIRKGKNFDGSQLEKLNSLSKEMHPSNLADMVRTYAFSREWSALDVADVEDGEELGPLEARERIFNLCIDLGRQLAGSRTELDQLLSEILTADSQKTFALGNGIAAACDTVKEVWDLLVERYCALPESVRRPTLLGGFLVGLKSRELSEVESLLDELLVDSRMHPDFLYCQSSAGINEAAFGRLMRALDFETIPLQTFKALAYGRAHEGLDDEQVRRLAGKILSKSGGVDVVLEILGMRIFGLQSNKARIGEVLRAAGRDLLEQLHFEALKPHSEHMLGQIVTASLSSGTDEPLARQICLRFMEAIKRCEVYGWDFPDLIEALIKTFPVVALDCLVGGDKQEGYGNARNVFRDIRDNNRPCPLEAIPEEIWLDWAGADPLVRYAKLAEVIKFSKSNDDEPATAWSDMAEKLIVSAPDPVKVLDIFFDRFRPTSWSGSRADILASRLPMMEALLHHQRPEVVEWVKNNIAAFEIEISRERESEAESDRKRDETFE